MNNTPLRAVALVCTLSPSPKPSSSQLLAEQTMAALAEHGVTGKTIRTDYQDLDKTPEKTAATTKTLAANTAHLARRLKARDPTRRPGRARIARGKPGRVQQCPSAVGPTTQGPVSERDAAGDGGRADVCPARRRVRACHAPLQ
ncbi:hypothetical protein [Streptomyces sp. NPDC088748]|uniref:hypothetical protein n=1 Tax=Streptomyces sp. NPDC088748 TaxID=3365887 RepID=UPI00381FFCEC